MSFIFGKALMVDPARRKINISIFDLRYIFTPNMQVHCGGEGRGSMNGSLSMDKR